MNVNEKPLPPGPKGLDAAKFLINSTRDFKRPMTEMALEYGEVAHVRNRRRDFIVVSGHEAAKHVLITNQDNYRKGLEYELLRIVLGEGLLTSEGETWRKQRRLVQPMFAKRYLKNFTEHMTRATAEVLDGEPFAELPEGATLDISEVMMALTLDIVGRALFGADLSGETARKVGPAMNDVLSLGTKMTRRLPTFVLANLPGMNLEKAMAVNPEGRRFQAALADLKSVIDELLEERSRQSDPGDDLVGLMLAARDEETGATMSREQIGDELMTFMLAGHETTSNALAWTWRRLSLNPGAREQLFAEVDSVLGDRVPDMDDLDSLPWTRACIEESMRVDSPVWTVGRQAKEEDEILGYRIPKRASVMVLISLIHRDPRIWSNPEGYDPTRFLPENAKGRPRHAFMPFGAGRRVCVGSTFAMVEATLLAAMFARRLRFDLPAEAEVEAEAVITLRPRHGMPMHVFHRQHDPVPGEAPEPDLAAV